MLENYEKNYLKILNLLDLKILGMGYGILTIWFFTSQWYNNSERW
jgi:hypothetical protein